MLLCGGREAMVTAPPAMHDLVVSPCFHICPAFQHRLFPLQSHPSLLLNLSLHSTAALALGLLKLAATVLSRGLVSLTGKDWFSFHLGCLRSAVSLSALNVSPLTQTSMWEWTPASVSPPGEGRSSPTNTPVSPPSFFILPSFVWYCIFFSSGQVLLSTVSWCSACTSVFEDVFLMHPWREMYSTSTYPSAFLFSFSVFIFISFFLMLLFCSNLFLDFVWNFKSVSFLFFPQNLCI